MDQTLGWYGGDGLRRTPQRLDESTRLYTVSSRLVIRRSGVEAVAVMMQKRPCAMLVDGVG